MVAVFIADGQMGQTPNKWLPWFTDCCLKFRTEPPCLHLGKASRS